MRPLRLPLVCDPRSFLILLLTMPLVASADTLSLGVYIRDMEETGQVQQVTTSTGDRLRLTVELLQGNGDPAAGHTIELLSEAGNELVARELQTDHRGWAEIELHPVYPGADRLIITAGDARQVVFLQIADSAFGRRMESPDNRAASLPEVGGVVPWELLADIETREGRYGLPSPVFSDAVRELDRQSVKLQGFMLPLENSERQRHFILTRSPPSCFYCLPDGPEQVVEVHSREPIRFTFDPIVISGTMELLEDSDLGLFYRLKAARRQD
ncbi:MAG: DUF3299 domain-containing protein [Ectothiorhodospiraceae bacterium]|nr:DUF3299 domain-containing protein [Ectothiorhodospiraceae bacterium]